MKHRNIFAGHIAPTQHQPAASASTGTLSVQARIAWLQHNVGALEKKLAQFVADVSRVDAMLSAQEAKIASLKQSGAALSQRLGGSASAGAPRPLDQAQRPAYAAHGGDGHTYRIV